MSTSEVHLHLKLKLQPKQSAFDYFWEHSPYTRLGYGGSRGSGKSAGARRIIFLRRFEYPGTIGLILRRTQPELYQSHIIKFFEEFPETRDWYNVVRKEMVIPGTGSRLFFGSAEHERDMSAFYSSEYADILVDEAQEFSEYELNQLSGSNRCTSNREIVPKMAFTFMPGEATPGVPPIGLAYLKRVFVEMLLKPEEKQSKWAFIPARAWDNVEWSRINLFRDGFHCDEHSDVRVKWDRCEDCMRIQEEVYYSWPEEQRKNYLLATAYGNTLSSVTDKGLRAAWLDGEFGNFQGQYFQNFNPQRHVISRAEAMARIKPWHIKWMSGDWGYEHPTDCQWHSQDEHGRVITFKEFWGRRLHEHILARELGQVSGYRLNSDGETWDLDFNEKRGYPHPGDLQSFVFSWDAGKLSNRAPEKFPKSINEMISEALPAPHPKPHPADSSPGSRIARARLMSQLLDANIAGLPAWQIVGEDCPQLVDCLPTLIRDPGNREDVLKVDYSTGCLGDDPYDCAAIGLQHMLGEAWKPKEVERREAIEKVKAEGGDMTAVHMANLLFEANWAQSHRPFQAKARCRRK